MTNVRRPWVPDDAALVWIGEQLTTLSDDQKEALDYWCGYLAAQQFVEGKPDAANAYLSLVGQIRSLVAELPQARKRATAVFDPRKLLRPEDIPEVEVEGYSSDELERVARGARSGGSAAGVGATNTSTSSRANKPVK